ncbi:META domain-containing protein [Nocardia halotolerans]|uniref:META domain-containing protein n=1 Tax=Nocardia halotolerans TaxID=1755878 RepID=A0ABV8VG21_9NOCA
MRITPSRLVVLLALAGTVVAGCGSADDDEPPQDTAMPMGHTYISTEVEGGAIPGGGPMTLTFADGRISAHSGCNTASGPVDLSEHTLRVDKLTSTLMACTDGRGEADAWQNSFLEADPRWHLDGPTLTLTGDNITVRLTDKEIVHPDKPLTGTEWVVTALLTPDAQVRSTVLDEVAPNLTITEDGRVSGHAGCNRLTGTAELGPGESVTFAVATTKVMCAPDVMDVEQQVLRALDGHTTATVDADTLTLRNDNGHGLVLHTE